MDAEPVVVFDYLPLFRDRVQAGELLAERLEAYRGRQTVVLGIPRGGVPVAAAVALRLDAELDIIVARKLGAPQQPELALGAVTATGDRYLNQPILEELHVPEAYLERVTTEQVAEARQREERFRGTRPPSRIQGRVAIVVDDGLATGATMRAALRSARGQRPSRLVMAVPVGPPQSCSALAAEADEVVCLYQPSPFWAVGLHYERFQPPQDADIQHLLEEAHARYAGQPAAPDAGPS